MLKILTSLCNRYSPVKQQYPYVINVHEHPCFLFKTIHELNGVSLKGIPPFSYILVDNDLSDNPIFDEINDMQEDK